MFLPTAATELMNRFFFFVFFFHWLRRKEKKTVAYSYILPVGSSNRFAFRENRYIFAQKQILLFLLNLVTEREESCLGRFSVLQNPVWVKFCGVDF